MASSWYWRDNILSFWYHIQQILYQEVFYIADILSIGLDLYIVDIILTALVFLDLQPGVYLLKVDNENNKKVVVFIQN